MMEIFSYVITHDTGFAPNPFGGLLSLATCKPQIRRTAEANDWVIGTGSASSVGNGKLVYAGRISKVITIESYGKSSEYQIKIPKVRGSWWMKHGDNIYSKKANVWRQRRNPHHGQKEKEHDLSGKKVLLCNKFWYFGKSAVNIPNKLQTIVKKGPGHKRVKDKKLLTNLFCGWRNCLMA